MTFLLQDAWLAKDHNTTTWNQQIVRRCSIQWAKLIVASPFLFTLLWQNWSVVLALHHRVMTHLRTMESTQEARAYLGWTPSRPEQFWCFLNSSTCTRTFITWRCSLKLALFLRFNISPRSNPFVSGLSQKPFVWDREMSNRNKE